MGGFVIRKLRKVCSGDMKTAVEDLVDNDEDTEPMENEEWIGAINRGGLIRISDDTSNSVCHRICDTQLLQW